MNQFEEWRAVLGFENVYEVSNLGRVRSVDRIIRYGKHLFFKKGCLRKPVANKSTGYLMIYLRDGKNHNKITTIHRLVATAFCPNPNNEECVNHINENKHDNRAENLEWCSKRYNNLYNGKNKKNHKAVVRVDLQTGEEVVFLNAYLAAKSTPNTNNKNISAVCRGQRNMCGGFGWHFQEE